jgi:hypothetical protein
MTEQIISERVTGQKNFLFEIFVIGRFAFLDYFPVEKHDFPELLGLVLNGNDG